jgi:predicted nucleotidyltransferase
MERDRILGILREHEQELKAAGVLHLGIFGSVAHGHNTSESDIDLLAEFDESRRISLVTIGGIQVDLTEWLGTRVDLSSPNWMKPQVKESALQEAVFAF